MRQLITEELLDTDQGSPREIRESLQDLWRVNRYLGGLRCLRRLLEIAVAQAPVAATWRCPEQSGHPSPASEARPQRPKGAASTSGAVAPPRPLTLLDAGAGTGHVGMWLRAWLEEKGIDARVCVLDRRLSHLLAGRDLNASSCSAAAVLPLVADALDLPLPDESIDVVTCNLFLHHFHGEDAVALLRSLLRVARHAVVISDLERSLWPWLAIRLAPRPLVSRLSRFDGPASVRQAYRPDELRHLLQLAGAERPTIVRVWPWRLGAILWKRTVTEIPAGPGST